MTSPPRKSHDLAGLAAVLVTLLLSLTVTALAWRLAWTDVRRVAQSRFEFRANEITAAIRSRMFGQEQVLRGLTALFAASEAVSRQEWKTYFDELRLQKNYPGIQGVGFCKYVPRGAKEAHIREVMAEGFPNYAVHPPGDRDEYAVVVYLEPFTGRNLRAFGYDMFSEPVRRAALERARDTGEATISGKLTLIQETTTDVQSGFQMYLPVYRTNAVANRRDALVGFVFSPFRMKDLMTGILGRELADVRLQIFDGANANPESMMYDSEEREGATYPNPTFITDTHIDTNGPSWTLRFSSNPSFEARLEKRQPAIVAGAGVLASLLLSIIVWALATNRERAIALARRMTTALRRSEESLAEAQKMARLGNWTYYRLTSEAVWSAETYRIFGLPEDSPPPTGQAFIELIYEEDREAYEQNFIAALQQGRPYEMEYRLKNAASGVRWVHSVGQPVVDKGGVAMVRGTVHDITERKERDAALRLSEHRLSLALAGSRLALFDWDLREEKIYLSEQWSQMLGGPAVETVANANELRKLVHPNDIDGLMAHLLQVLQGEEPMYRVEHRVKTIDGRWIWILSQGKVVERDRAGRAVRLLGTNADISEQKRLDEAKSEFISTVSHELRTPLTAIMGSLAILQEEMPENSPAHIRQFLNMANRNGQRLAALVNDILDMEKLDAGMMEFRCESVDLATFLQQAIELNSQYAAGFQVTLVMQPIASPIKIYADPERLMQVVTNLISNAAKFSPAGESVTISVATVNDNRVRVTVSDRGPGVPEAFRDRIFQRFAQADSSDTRKKGGTGLGLSLCKAMIERMGGVIGFDSESGKGASFYFELRRWAD